MTSTLGTNTHWKQTGRQKRKRVRRAKKEKVPIGAGIYNISGSVLSEDELKVLDKGLKFAPINFKFISVCRSLLEPLILNSTSFLNLGKEAPNLALGSPLGFIPIWQIKKVFNPPKSDNRHIAVF